MRLALLLAARGGGSFLGGSVSNDLGITNVKNYGATGDGTTDDTSAIASAIAALPAAGGVLYFPPGTYKTSGGFTISTPCVVLGAGGGGGETLAYDSGGGTVPHISQITCTSQTAVLFTVSASGVQFHDLSLKNTYAGTPSAGAAIRTASGGGDHAQYVGVTFQGFYVNLDHAYGREYMIARCYNLDPVSIGFHLRNTSANDVLEVTITQCQSLENLYSAEAMFKFSRGGGIRIADCLFFALGPSNATSPVTCIKVDLAVASSDLFISGCEFENFTDTAIYITGSASPAIYHILINGNEFVDGRSTAKQAIVINKGSRIVVSSNVFLGSDQAYNAIDLDNSSHAVITGNYWESFAAFQGGSGSSDINAASNYGAP